MTRRAERKVWDRSGGWGPVQTCLGLSRPGGSLSRQFNPIREKLLLSSAKWSKWSKSMQCSSRLTQPHASTFQRLSGWRGTSCALRKTVWNKKVAFTYKYRFMGFWAQKTGQSGWMKWISLRLLQLLKGDGVGMMPPFEMIYINN